MSGISARIIADSICHTRITTFELTLPRMLLAELNTHCMLIRSCASSRAIPVEKRIKMVRNNPFVPEFWGANQRGMQADESLPMTEIEGIRQTWIDASLMACRSAEVLARRGSHKQTANRLIENFCYVTDIVTGTEWANFFNLRVSAHAQPEFDELAGLALREYQTHEPVQLRSGQWHLPYGDRIGEDLSEEDRLDISVARCARVSYETQSGEIDYVADLKLAKMLRENGHWSPYGHIAQAVHPDSILPFPHMTVNGINLFLQNENALWDGKDLWWAQLRWWRMLRKLQPNENLKEMDGEKLLRGWAERRNERGIKK